MRDAIFRGLARVAYELFATVGFVCGMLGIPPGKSRRAIEYLVRVGITTAAGTVALAFAVATLAAFIGAFAGLAAMWSGFLIGFSTPMLELFAGCSFVLALLAIRFPSHKYQQPADDSVHHA